MIHLKNASILRMWHFIFAGLVMAGYCILRTEKHNTIGSVSAALSHDLRARHTPNADPKLYENNTYSSTEIDSILSEMNRIVDSCGDNKCQNDKPVLCVQYLITASPEAAENPAFSFDKYLNDGLESLKKKHGAENVIFSAIHRDETTPHMTVYVVPVVEEPTKKVRRSVYTGKTDEAGNKIREVREFDSKPKRRLSAAHFLDGAGKMSAMQTWFHETVGAGHGLERGVVGSKAKHVPISQFYEAINKLMQQIKLPSLQPKEIGKEKNLFGIEKPIYEDIEQLTTRVINSLNAQVMPLIKKAGDADNLRKKNKALSSDNKKLSSDNEKLRKVITSLQKGISVSDIRGRELTVLAECSELGEKNKSLQAEIDSKNLLIQNGESKLSTLNKEIADAQRAASNIAQSFSNRCVSLLHAVFQRDVRDVANNINDLSECIQEILTDAPELADVLIKETRAIDEKMEQPLFESIIIRNKPR